MTIMEIEGLLADYYFFNYEKITETKNTAKFLLKLNFALSFNTIKILRLYFN